MGFYLEDNPPKRSQFREDRRAKVTGAIVLHTAENNPDLSDPDSGSENVAKYIAGRTSPGSYHSVIDSRSVLRLVRYEWEAFHDGTGGNRWSLSLAFATKASNWQLLPSSWVDDAIYNGATEARAMADWVLATEGVVVPAARITAQQYRDGMPGFVTHAELDPGRHSDPGSQFPWPDFLDQFAEFDNNHAEFGDDYAEFGDDYSEFDNTHAGSVVNRVNHSDAPGIEDATITQEVPNFARQVPQERKTTSESSAGALQTPPLPPSLQTSYESAPQLSKIVDRVAKRTPERAQPASKYSLPYSVAMDDVDELYRAYTGSRPATSVRSVIARDLAVHVFVEKRDSFDFVANVERSLRTDE